MKITEHIHALKIPFEITLAPDVVLKRFVWVYFILGKKVWLVDSGVAGCWPLIGDYLDKLGKNPRDIELCILTHPHPDHIGSAVELSQQTACRFACHHDCREWIEDVEIQKKQRPVPGFDKLVEGSVKIDMEICDGQLLEFARGRTLRVLQTPGHNCGHISLYDETDGVLISGDCVMPTMSMPIYDDAAKLTDSVKRFKTLHAGVLLSSLAEPIFGEQAVERALDEALDYMKLIDTKTESILAKNADISDDELTKQVIAELKLPPHIANPISVQAIKSHRQKPVCMIVDIKVLNRELYLQYIARVPEIVREFGGKYYARGGKITPLMGDWRPERIIMVEFPSMQLLEKWLHSPQYRQIAPLREKSTITNAIVVELA